MYDEETEQEKPDAAEHIKQLNADMKVRDNKPQIQARQALGLIRECDIKRRHNTRKLQYVPSNMD